MDIQDTSSTNALPDKATLLDLSNKKPGSMFELGFSGLGLLGRWLSCILGKRFPIEVRSDWLRVSVMHRRIVERIFSEAEADPKDKPIPPKDLNLLSMSRGCLCAARRTHMLEAAWRYVNQASEILSHVADEEERSQLAERFLEWEPGLDEGLKNIYEKTMVQKFVENRKDAKEDRAKMIRTYSRQWALINQANLFRIRITRNVTLVFLASLTCMLLATKFVINVNPHSGVIIEPYPYIAIYGLFGAALSILLGVRKLRPGAVTYRTLWFSLLLRLALGAGGAFVTYVVVITTGILSGSLLDSFQKMPGFIALGIAAGFSERLFRSVLEMFVKRIESPKPD
jgi:hypothetical protein